MKELRDCCLNYVSGGDYYGSSKYCPICAPEEYEREMAEKARLQRGALTAGSIVGGGVASMAGLGPWGSRIVAGATGMAAAEVAGIIYDNPSAAEHPDYNSPTGNIINNKLGY